MELIEINGDRVKNIAFNEDLPEEFCLTADANVVFCKWVSMNFSIRIYLW